MSNLIWKTFIQIMLSSCPSRPPAFRIMLLRRTGAIFSPVRQAFSPVRRPKQADGSGRERTGRTRPPVRPKTIENTGLTSLADRADSIFLSFNF